VTLISAKRTVLFVAIALCLLVAGLVPGLAQASGESYVYNMSFDHDGFTSVQILYYSGSAGSGASWVAVPANFTATSVRAVVGTISSMKRVAYLVGTDKQPHPFYDNLTFSYISDSEPFSMRIRFNMTQGAMIVEPDGFFFSPQIGVPPYAAVQVILVLPDGVKALHEVQPAPTRIDSLGSNMELFFSPASESRIAVTFTVSWPKQTSHIREGIVDAEVPSRYLDLGGRMVALYRAAVPLMNDLFNNTMNQILMRFFTPQTLPDVGIGGYTPMDPSSVQSGAVYLNLFYFRSLPGTMETIAIHELTHQYVVRAGVSSDLLWVHEGLANYVAVQMGKPLGYDVAPTDEELEATARDLNGDYGFIQDWRPGGTTGSLFDYYAASYQIFKTLGDEYGGVSMYAKFFRGVRELKDGLRSTNVAVYQLSLAAGANLSPQFREWKFELVDLSSISARIAKLRAEAEWYGPLLPFRAEALAHLQMAESSMYSAPEVAMAHITIAAFYIETVPMIIGGVVLVLSLLAVVAVIASRRSRRRRQESDSYAGL
jgi:hypothetical protein